MHDIRFIRKNPEAFDKALKRRGLVPKAERVLELDKNRRNTIVALNRFQEEHNKVSREIGEILKDAGGATISMPDEMERMDDASSAIKRCEVIEKDLGDKIAKILMELPNILDDRVPDGKDESANKLIRSHGEKPDLGFPPRDHVAIGQWLGMMDFTTAAKLSGARFVVLKDGLARLERALAAFMLDTHRRKGYQEILPPSLVTTDTMTGTGQLPKFADDLFQTTDKRWLIPTAEVPLTNMVAGEILDAKTLPLRLTAYTPCFRAEAGAAGRDTRGMIRQHQFSKVELVSITHPDDSDAELERMTQCAEAILQELKLPYRVMLLSAGDTGFSARITYDIEVWLPGQKDGAGTYREISSCSNCGDFQARRMKARFRKKGEKGTQFVHTLNGSGLAIGRTMIAILENYQQADGSVAIPEALQTYMGGDKVLKAGQD